MSLFETLGQQTERVKQKITSSGDDSSYACLSCEERFDENHEFCPQCGDEAVVVAE